MLLYYLLSISSTKVFIIVYLVSILLFCYFYLFIKNVILLYKLKYGIIDIEILVTSLDNFYLDYSMYNVQMYTMYIVHIIHL